METMRKLHQISFSCDLNSYHLELSEVCHVVELYHQSEAKRLSLPRLCKEVQYDFDYTWCFFHPKYSIGSLESLSVVGLTQSPLMQ